MKTNQHLVHAALSELGDRHGITHHPLTIADFYAVCKARAIELVRVDTAHAFAFSVGDSVAINLGSRIDEARLPFVAFHELGHCIMHLNSDNSTPGDQREIEADAFAEMATNLKRL